MKRDGKSKSKINTDDGWNRTFYGSPTIGGFVVMGMIAAFIIYNIFFR